MIPATWHEGCPTCGALRHIDADMGEWLIIARCTCGEGPEYVEKAPLRAALQREIDR